MDIFHNLILSTLMFMPAQRREECGGMAGLGFVSILTGKLWNPYLLGKGVCRPAQSHQSAIESVMLLFSWVGVQLGKWSQDRKRSS